MGPVPKTLPSRDPPFPGTAATPTGFSRVPGTRKGSIHPQRSPFQTLELQGEPPTPGRRGGGAMASSVPPSSLQLSGMGQ